MQKTGVEAPLCSPIWDILNRSEQMRSRDLYKTLTLTTKGTRKSNKKVTPLKHCVLAHLRWILEYFRKLSPAYKGSSKFRCARVTAVWPSYLMRLLYSASPGMLG